MTINCPKIKKLPNERFSVQINSIAEVDMDLFLMTCHMQLYLLIQLSKVTCTMTVTECTFTIMTDQRELLLLPLKQRTELGYFQ